LKEHKEEITIDFPNNSLIALIIGTQSINLSKLEKLIEVRINSFGNQFNIFGNIEKIKLAKIILTNIYNDLSNQKGINIVCEFSKFEDQFRMLQNHNINKLTINKKNEYNSLQIETWKKTIVPKSIGQKTYFEALKNFELVFGLGPAGTGKSYLAVAKGIEMLKKGFVEKIILTRPAVEAGERLGFLPGDMKEKIDPYLRPIYDALYEMMPADRVEKKFNLVK
tara:strand:+ start:1134 stop:1802 length:669 start_codon:yes stop_codon:yes gene_type:complete